MTLKVPLWPLAVQHLSKVFFWMKTLRLSFLKIQWKLDLTKSSAKRTISLFSQKSLALICRRCICEVAAGTTRATFRTNENVRRWHPEPSQSFTAGMPVKLNLSQLGTSQDWEDQCCRPLLLSYRNSTPGSTGGHVSGASAAYENQA